MKKKYFKAAMKVLAIMITGVLLFEVLFINTEASPLKTNEEEINETEAVAEETETAQPSAENTDKSNEMMIPQPIPFMEHPIAEDAHEYYSRSVFVGDSIMAGYRTYSAYYKDSPVSTATFLAVPSYTSWRAVKSSGSIQPLYKGKKQSVCANLSEMDNVDRVFILFGANDLLMKDAFRAADDMMTLVDQIHETNPEIEVHIVSMTPVPAGVNKGALNNPSIDGFNGLLIQGAKEHGAYYIDINTALKDTTGNLPGRYCWDGFVHVNNAAYAEVWDPIFARYAVSEE